MIRHAVRSLGDLGPRLTLAPERHGPDAETRGIPISELAVEARARLRPGAGTTAFVLDTTHARDGVIELPAPEDAARARTKLAVPVGALLVSRLRPYLRQVGFVSPSLVSMLGGHARPALGCSPEFSVLVAREEGESLAYLVPFFLSKPVQERLARGQEGGHRPRVPRETVMTLRVSRAVFADRRRRSAAVERALADLYAARSRLREALERIR
jgi:hypothetical protein